LKVLSKHYPEVLATSPSIGRQGKAFRRQQQRKSLETPAAVDTTRKGQEFDRLNSIISETKITLLISIVHCRHGWQETHEADKLEFRHVFFFWEVLLVSIFPLESRTPSRSRPECHMEWSWCIHCKLFLNALAFSSVSDSHNLMDVCLWYCQTQKKCRNW